MMRMLAFALYPALALAGCPSDISELRSASVLATSFDAALLNGTWNEVAYTDPAQVGASCQKSENTYHAADGKIDQKFTCKYGRIPFGMTYEYAPVAGVPGRYDKYAKGLSNLLILPTAVVDVRWAEDGSAQHMSEYTCKDGVTEFRVSSRDLTMAPGLYQDMLDVALAAGVPSEIIAKVSVNDYAGC